MHVSMAYSYTNKALIRKGARIVANIRADSSLILGSLEFYTIIYPKCIIPKLAIIP